MGVPQGTVLGPLVFLLYINDIADDLHSEIRLFADDCILYNIVKSTADCGKLQQDIDQLYRWGNKWQMTFKFIAQKKCYVMNMGNKREETDQLKASWPDLGNC